jgi:hypothetical protein
MLSVIGKHTKEACKGRIIHHQGYQPVQASQSAKAHDKIGDETENELFHALAPASIM